MLTDDERATYSAIADVLIPEAEGMPSASQADVPTRWVEEALKHRPDLEGGLHEALQASVGQAPDAAVEMLNRDHIPAFEALGTLTAGAYFLNPEIRERIGYPGQVATLARTDMDSYADLLEEVLERGQVYREAPAETAEDGGRA